MHVDSSGDAVLPIPLTEPNLRLLSLVAMAPTFADVVPIKQLSSHKYTIPLETEWCIGTGQKNLLLPRFALD
jgi:hypothetical protein